ncbi:polysaccharide deacetylase family protein [Comamonas endophytica]
MQVLEEFGAACTVSACGAAVQRLPELARDAFRRGHEISAHGWRWESHAQLPAEVERDNIRRTVAAIEQATGVRPVGWHTRSASSPRTRALLIEQGFLYDSDFYGDDLPVRVPNPQGRPYVMLPYAFDTNDMHFQHTQRFSTAKEFADYVIEAIDWLWKEGETQPRMLSIGLHLRMLGRPARIGALHRILAHIQQKGSIWVARRDAIANHWLQLDA